MCYQIEFNLTIKKGEKVAFVGQSGAGKSTLVYLLLRLYQVDKGEILVDGVPINKWKLSSLRSLFGYVGQEIFLFNDTIKENLEMGNNFAEKKLQESFLISGSEEFVRTLDKKTKTIIGDRGTLLSGGQRQRLTIARAFLKNPPILLFDEATSALDNESERKVQQALDKLAHNHTVISIAHRLTTVMDYDRIVVLKEGRVVEIGKHDQLINSRGDYFNLYQLGLKGESQCLMSN